MTLTPPRLAPKIANIWTANPALEYELAQEKASALGRLGRGLEAALDALRSFDAGAPMSVHHCFWPAVQTERIDRDLLAGMAIARTVVTLGPSELKFPV